MRTPKTWQLFLKLTIKDIYYGIGIFENMRTHNIVIIPT